MNRIILIAFFLLLFPIGVESETITLASGEVVEGTVIERSDDFITIDQGSGISLTYYLDEIFLVDGQSPLSEPETSQEVKNDVLLEEILDYGTFSYTTPAKSFIWEIKSDITKVYVLGSIHVGREDFYPLPVAMEKAYLDSDILVVENDTEGISDGDEDKLKKLKTIMRNKAFYSDGHTLKDDISEATLSQLKEFLAVYEMDVTPFLLYKPATLTQILEMMVMAKSGFIPDFGIDEHFLRMARNHKKIISIEDVDDYFDLIDAIPDKSQFVEYFLSDIKNTSQELVRLIRAWKRGDDKEFYEIIHQPLDEQSLEMAKFYKMLILDRNEQMVEKIKGYLQTDHIYFVVVGAGHLVGDKGIIFQLEDAGYQVRQL